jgi:hypothetical protein
MPFDRLYLRLRGPIPGNCMLHQTGLVGGFGGVIVASDM